MFNQVRVRTGIMVLEPGVVVLACLPGTLSDSRPFRVVNSDSCKNSRLKGQVNSPSG